MDSSAPGTTRTCVSCGRAIGFEANVCPYCGHDYRVPVYAMAPPPQKSMALTAGGILVILAGVLALVMGALYLAMDASDIENSGVTFPDEFTADDLQTVLYVCGSLCLVFGVIAIIGGFFGLQRKHFALALVGGIFGILGIGFLLGSLLALIGLILIVVGRKEFT